MTSELAAIAACGAAFLMGAAACAARRGRAGLLVEKERFRALVEHAPDAVLVVDSKGAVVLANLRAEELFGFPSGGLRGASVEDLVPEAARAKHSEHRRAYARGPGARPMGRGRYLQARRRDGSVFSVEISLSPVFEPGGGHSVIAILRDVSERQAAARRLRAAVKERETLLREVHHRVKNNLQVVSSLLGMAAERAPSAAGVLEESRRRVRAISAVHEALHHARGLDRVPVLEFLSTVARELAASQGAPVPEMSVESSDLPMDVAVPLGLIVGELVANAYKHGYEAGAAGRVGVALTREGGAYRLAVRDWGRGAPPGFEGGAQGLGLRLVGLLAGQLGGRLRYDARPDGVLVELDFPASPEPA